MIKFIESLDKRDSPFYHAPVAQWRELCPPEACATVRFRSGVIKKIPAYQFDIQVFFYSLSNIILFCISGSKIPDLNISISRLYGA